MKTSSTLNRRDCMKMVAGSAVGVAASLATATAQIQGVEAEQQSAPIVDTHMHVWSDDPQRFPFSHPFKPDFKEPPTSATMEMLLADMGQNGVTHSILVQCIYHGWDNRYIAKCARAHPNRFRAQGLIDLTKTDVAEKLEYWMTEHGLSGMRLNPIYYKGRDEWLNSSASHALWKKAEKLGAVFNLFIASEQLPKMQEMVQQYPAVPVLIDHIAYVQADASETERDNLLAMAKYQNVSIKVSELQSISPQKTYPYRDSYDWVKRIYDAFGPDRLLWGTGFPGAARSNYKCPTLKQELDLIRTEIPFFTAADKKKILGLNAARIWKL